MYFKPYLKQIGEANFDMLTYFLFNMYFPPIIYLFSTIATLHWASLLWRLEIHSSSVKRTLLIASIAVLAFYYIVVLLWFFNAVNYFLFNVTSIMARIPVLFLLPGIGLFLGTQKHRLNNRDNANQAS
jgi:ABC-type sugar transport system permease subunit